MARVRVPLVPLILRRGGWALAFPLVFALGFGAAALWAVGEVRLLDRYGIEGRAEVTAKFIREGRDSDGRRTVTYYVAYVFTTEAGRTVEADRSVGRGFFDRVMTGDLIWVRYVAHDPDRHEIEPGITRLLVLVFGIVSAGGWLAAGAGLWWLWRRLAPALRAVRDGEVREARVIAQTASGIRVFGQELLRLNWRDARGTQGQSGALRPARLRGWPVGSVVVVYVDPVTGQSFWEEDMAPGAAPSPGER